MKDQFNSAVEQLSHFLHSSRRDIIHYGILLRQDYAPKNWDELAASRQRHCAMFLPMEITGELLNEGLRPVTDRELNLFPQALKNNKTQYTSIPECKVGKFGNRLSRNCNLQIDYIDTSKKSIAFFGCSFTFGETIDADSIYINQVVDSFAAKINAPILGYNLGNSGNSIEAIADQFEAVTALRNFDYCIFLMPSMERFVAFEDFDDRRFQTKTEKNKLINSYHKVNVFPVTLSSLATPRQIKKAEATTELEVYNRVVKELFRIERICQQKKIKAFYSSWEADTYTLLSSVLDKNSVLPFFQCSLPPPDITDFGADGSHPGPMVHAAFAKRVANWLQEREI